MVYNRISYKKTGNPYVLKSKMYKAEDNMSYSIMLYLKTLEFHIFEAPCGSKLISGEAYSLPRLKKAAREAIKSLGVQFLEVIDDEG